MLVEITHIEQAIVEYEHNLFINHKNILPLLSEVFTQNTQNKHPVCCHAFRVLVNNLMDSVSWTVIFLQDCKHQSMHINCDIVRVSC